MEIMSKHTIDITKNKEYGMLLSIGNESSCLLISQNKLTNKKQLEVWQLYCNDFWHLSRIWYI
jgi:hypothetical protein